MKYVDGFVIPIPTKNLPAYKRMAYEGGKIWKKYGALEYFECVGEDLHPKVEPEMKGVNFPKMAKTKRGETVVFSFIVYKSKAHRDKVNAMVMKDPSMAKWEGKSMPFDMKRVAYGGFKTIVDL